MSGKKAVFLDRDGVINQERGDFTWKLEDFILVEGLIPFLKTLVANGFDLVVITNQSGIAKGLYGHEEVELLHFWLRKKLAEDDIVLKEIYYCPHHPDYGKCLCRKPGSLLIEKALARFGYSPEQCVMIGDRERDVLAAEGAGVRGILVASNSNLNYLLPEILQSRG